MADNNRTDCAARAFSPMGCWDVLEDEMTMNDLLNMMEDDFEKTVSLMKKVEFINSYSFIFSARPGTPAANLKKIDEKIAKERLGIFQRAADEVKTKYRKKLVNSTTSVLFENNARDVNKYFGRDKFLNSVVVESTQDLTGKILNISINNFNHNSLFGIISSNKKRNFAA